MFLDFLRSIPGRNVSTMKYIFRDKDEPSVIPGEDLPEEYINCAPVGGNEFMIDIAEVSAYLTNFISVNTTTEAKLPSQANQHNGCIDISKLQLR